MKILKSLAKFIFAFIFVVFLSLVGYYYWSKPNYEGEVTMKNLSDKSTVYFDEFGVPHIYASSEKDAMQTLGYVHAQERLWQMEVMRRIAPGRLSEIFGSVMLKNDTFFKALAIDEAAKKAISELDKNSEAYKMALAYLEGVNLYIEEGKTPIEFTLLGIKKEKLSLNDVYNIFGYMSFSFAMAQKSDPLLTDIRDNLGAQYLNDFGLDISLNSKRLPNFDGEVKEYSQMAIAVANVIDGIPVGAFVGSNSWVIGASKTKNKKVLFANDPHIMFSQPATWYEAHIVTPNHEIYGYYLAGTPFPLLGHNHDYAYGLTMFENDDLDLFLEKNNPNNSNQFQTKTGFQNYQITTKTIKIKDSTDVVLKIKYANGRPIMSGIIDNVSKNKPISLSWIFTQEKNEILQAVYQLSHSNNLNEFKKGVSLVHAPGLNIMYGDKWDNIAWITSGKLYQMKANPNFILDASDENAIRKEFLPFSKNPRAINPPKDYVYSANNQPKAVDDYLYPGYYLPKDRAMRIDTLLAVKNDWTAEDVQKMLLDNTSATAQNTVKNWISAISNPKSEAEKKALQILKSWKGTNNLEDNAPTIFNKWTFFYLKNTFEDELGKDNFNLFLSTHIIKQIISNQSASVNSVWWNNVKTKNKIETRQEIMTTSFAEAIASLENQLGTDLNNWKWKNVHILKHNHPLGKVKLLDTFLSVGNFEVAGSNEVINNLFFTYSDEKELMVKGGPSTRRIVDFSDVERSYSIIPTGQSGVFSSKHYADQAEMYAKGSFRKMELNPEKIQKSKSKLVFKPK
ncbi:MAG: penicillin amidase [Flavobacterium sp.]|jgi:penicillin amidase